MESMGLLGPEEHWTLRSVACSLQGEVGAGQLDPVRVTWQFVRAPGKKGPPVTARVSELRVGSISTICFL